MFNYFKLISVVCIAAMFASCSGKKVEGNLASLNFCDTIDVITLENDIATLWNDSLFLDRISKQSKWLETGSEDQQIQYLTDVYNAFTAIHDIFSGFDFFMRLESENDNERQSVLDKDLSVIKNQQMRDSLILYQSKMAELFDVDLDEVDTDIYNPFVYRNDIEATLVEPYNEELYKHFTDDEYYEIYDNCTSVPEMQELKAKRGDKTLVAELVDKLKNASDFDAQCVYAIELTHAYDAARENVKAIPLLVSLMDAEVYSIYLDEVWRTWRCLMQPLVGGHSKDSFIPNDGYNLYRKKCAQTTLHHIMQNPDDIIAVGQFGYLASLRNIDREGQYIYGNQVAIEEITLFYERYNFDEEDIEEETDGSE